MLKIIQSAKFMKISSHIYNIVPPHITHTKPPTVKTHIKTKSLPLPGLLAN